MIVLGKREREEGEKEEQEKVERRKSCTTAKIHRYRILNTSVYVVEQG